jgi:hypothetical protein
MLRLRENALFTAKGKRSGCTADASHLMGPRPLLPPHAQYNAHAAFEHVHAPLQGLARLEAAARRRFPPPPRAVDTQRNFTLQELDAERVSSAPQNAKDMHTHSSPSA